MPAFVTFDSAGHAPPDVRVACVHRRRGPGIGDTL